jgi:hypothetical protein
VQLDEGKVDEEGSGIRSCGRSSEGKGGERGMVGSWGSVASGFSTNGTSDLTCQSKKPKCSLPRLLRPIVKRMNVGCPCSRCLQLSSGSSPNPSICLIEISTEERPEPIGHKFQAFKGRKLVEGITHRYARNDENNSNLPDGERHWLVAATNSGL